RDLATGGRPNPDLGTQTPPPIRIAVPEADSHHAQITVAPPCRPHIGGPRLPPLDHSHLFSSTIERHGLAFLDAVDLERLESAARPQHEPVAAPRRLKRLALLPGRVLTPTVHAGRLDLHLQQPAGHQRRRIPHALKSHLYPPLLSKLPRAHDPAELAALRHAKPRVGGREPHPTRRRRRRQLDRVADSRPVAVHPRRHLLRPAHPYAHVPIRLFDPTAVRQLDHAVSATVRTHGAHLVVARRADPDVAQRPVTKLARLAI